MTMNFKTNFSDETCCISNNYPNSYTPDQFWLLSTTINYFLLDSLSYNLLTMGSVTPHSVKNIRKY